MESRLVNRGIRIPTKIQYLQVYAESVAEEGNFETIWDDKSILPPLNNKWEVQQVLQKSGCSENDHRKHRRFSRWHFIIRKFPN